jgi:hypothetical protein
VGIFWAMRLTHLRVRYRAANETGAPAALAAARVTTLAAPIAPPEWRPPCDVVETADAWTVRAELGGLADDAFEVLLYEDSVVVRGVRPWHAAPDVRVHLAELRYGPFRLALDLPPGIGRVGRAPWIAAGGTESEAFVRTIRALFRRAIELSELPEELARAAENVSEPRLLAYLVAASVPFPVEARPALLAIGSEVMLLRRLVELLQEEIAVREADPAAFDAHRSTSTSPRARSIPKDGPSAGSALAERPPRRRDAEAEQPAPAAH